MTCCGEARSATQLDLFAFALLFLSVILRAGRIIWCDWSAGRRASAGHLELLRIDGAASPGELRPPSMAVHKSMPDKIFRRRWNFPTAVIVFSATTIFGGDG